MQQILHAAYLEPCYILKRLGRCGDANLQPIHLAGRLEKKLTPPLGFIDPIFQQACGGNVAILIAEIVSLAHTGCQLFVVIA
jgi:hypothetical protein